MCHCVDCTPRLSVTVVVLRKLVFPGKFWTLPERDQDDGGAFRFTALSLYGLGDRAAAAERRDEIEAVCSAILAGDAKFCLALGEPSAHSGVPKQLLIAAAFGSFR